VNLTVADKDDDMLDRVNDMADRLQLTGSERRKYVHEHMTRSGYRAVPQYVRGSEDDEEEDDSSSFFGGSSRRRRGERDSGGSRGGRSRRNRDDDWYED
jgi:hypothetical protein